MSDNEKGDSILGQIIVAVVIAILVGGTTPWWWQEFFTNHPQGDSDTSPSSVDQNNSAKSPSSNVVSKTGVAIVFDPPSNVRKSPNGEILCSVRKRKTIDIYDSIGSWYYTDICGTIGVIHSSQIEF